MKRNIFKLLFVGVALCCLNTTSHAAKKEDVIQTKPSATVSYNEDSKEAKYAEVVDEQYADKYGLVNFIIGDNGYISDEKDLAIEIENGENEKKYKLKFDKNDGFYSLYLPAGRYVFTKILKSNGVISDENFYLDSNEFTVETGKAYQIPISGTFSEAGVVTENQYNTMVANGEDVSQIKEVKRKAGGVRFHLLQIKIALRNTFMFFGSIVKDLWKDILLLLILGSILVGSLVVKRLQKEE